MWNLLVLAQAATQPASSVSGAATSGSGSVTMGGGVPTISQLFMTSPYINSTILVLSFLAVAIFVFLLLGLTSNSFAPARFINELNQLINAGRYEQAVHLCRNNQRVFAGPILQRVLENRQQDAGVLMQVIETEGTRSADRVFNRISYLSEIATIAPTLGLLGTVVGMIKVFFTLTAPIVGTANVQDLSAGIAQAMGTTMFGLIVALMAGVFYVIAKSRATAILMQTEQVCHAVADQIGQVAHTDESKLASAADFADDPNQ